MSVNTGMMSSNTYEWETPQDVFDHYNSLFKFQLDVCASSSNAKCKKYYDISDDGLDIKNKWCKRNWMNPPYGKTIKRWVSRAKNEADINRNLTVCLLPARTDTKWWQDVVIKADHIYYIRGRLKFSDADAAPFPSAVAIFGLNYKR